MPTDEWERGYSAGYRAAHRTDVRDITSERGKSRPSPNPSGKRAPILSDMALLFVRLHHDSRRKTDHGRQMDSRMPRRQPTN